MNFGFMNVILLYSDLRHASATHVVIFRMVSARIQIRSVSGWPRDWPQHVGSHYIIKFTFTKTNFTSWSLY